MKILIAYDGSKHAQAALEDLRRAGLPGDTEATIISVAEMIIPTLQVHTRTPADAPPDQPFGPKEAEMLTRQAAERIKKAFPKWTLDTDFETGSAAWAIVEKADKLKPDLIIVGSHGRTALGRAIFGSTSQRVATDARCSVRVARTPLSDKPPRILLCIDGSEYAEAALNAVAARSWPEGAEVRMISAVGPFSGMRVSDFTQELDRTNTLQQTAAALLASNNIVTSTVSKDGDPKQVILEHAEEWGADCIFLGSRGLNRFHRFWLGSVSTAVVARALCSVEIVRKAASGQVASPSQ